MWSCLEQFVHTQQTYFSLLKKLLFPLINHRSTPRKVIYFYDYYYYYYMYYNNNDDDDYNNYDDYYYHY